VGPGAGAEEVVDFIVISGREAGGHYHLDEINKNISIFLGGKIVREHPIFS